jgi:hypothetical protein
MQLTAAADAVVGVSNSFSASLERRGMSMMSIQSGLDQQLPLVSGCEKLNYQLLLVSRMGFLASAKTQGK